MSHTRESDRNAEQGPLAIVCGGGAFPAAVAEAVRRRGREVLLFPLRGFADEAAIRGYPQQWIYLGAIGRFLRMVKQQGSRDVVFVGTVHRPRLRDIRLDWTTIRWLPAYVRVARQGDNHLLSNVARLFDHLGMRVRGVHEVAPELLVPPGVLGRHRPSETEESEIKLGRSALQALGPLDVGQAAVVIGGRVIAIEAAEGTAAMLARVAEVRRSGRVHAARARRRIGEGAEARAGAAARSAGDRHGYRRPGGGGRAQGHRGRGRRHDRRRRQRAGARGRRGRIVPARIRAGRGGRPVSRAARGEGKPLQVFIVAGEASGDLLGAGLMAALKARCGQENVRFRGVGGPAMAAQGLESLFALPEIAIIGFSGLLTGIPNILRRVRATADAALAARPDVLVLVDAPDFTHRVARRVRAGDPAIPIVDYVSPTVWAWRPGRARAMRAYVDRVLALLPFEPEVHQQARRAALHLCRPSHGRAGRGAASFRGGIAEAHGRAGAAPGAARQPPQGDRAAGSESSARRSAAWRRRA